VVMCNGVATARAMASPFSPHMAAGPLGLARLSFRRVERKRVEN
jgi:hypothetical protein